MGQTASWGVLKGPGAPQDVCQIAFTRWEAESSNLVVTDGCRRTRWRAQQHLRMEANGDMSQMS
jgi:hypothetical protein